MSTTGTEMKRAYGVGRGARGARVPSGLARLENDLEGLFEDFLSEVRPRRGWTGRLLDPSLSFAGDVVPRVDVLADGDDLVVRAEVPGIAKEDLEISVEGTTLTLHGEKRTEETTEEEKYFRNERNFGQISRVIELPAEVQADKAQASFADGVLEIRLPRTEEAKERAVRIGLS